MTDLECKKICKVLDIKDIWLNAENVVCVKNSKNEIGQVYVYEDSMSNALPLRMMKIPAKHSSAKKNFIEFLLKQSADGIRSALIIPGYHSVKSQSKTKLMNANESIESFLVRHDMLFSLKKKNKKRSEKTEKSVE